MSQYDRRTFLKAGLGAAIALPGVGGMATPPLFAAGTGAPATDPLRLDASAHPAAPPPLELHMGTNRRPDGQTLTVDSRSLLLSGTPWLPAMGEFHFSRYPETEWAYELRKMKAGGVDIVSSYVFWIHHEEVEGQWDWTGRRSLRGFARQCAEAGLHLQVRLGPWAHGEARHGGHPDWLLQKGVRLRSEDPAYLAQVRPLYAQIAGQLQGLLWKDGGPVVAVQVDNEYGGPASYLLALKAIARESGIDVPLYTRTGWPHLSTPMPVGELLPFFGVYPDGFWDRDLRAMPGGYPNGYRFRTVRSASAAAMGAQGVSGGDDAGPYPYLCCELGGGMETSYHRRIAIAPMDIAALALIKLGTGNNLQGYYMYHGGSNPDGRLTTMQESQETGGYCDLPVKTYDFAAPLGEFGQVREHYHRLRRLHLFLRDWGPSLAVLPARMPAVAPGTADDTTLRWAARTDGRSGFVFVNNYQRLHPMPAKTGVQFQINLAGGPLTFPKVPVTVPADTAFLWPFNLPLGGATLVYATAQPVCQVQDGSATVVIFAATPTVPAEFVFADAAAVRVESPTGAVARDGDRVRVSNVPPGTGAAVRLRSAGGRTTSLVLLSETQSLACWKGTLAGREHVFLAPAALSLDGDALRLSATDQKDLTLAVLPAPKSLTVNGKKAVANADGLFHRYALPRPRTSLAPVTMESVQAAGPARVIVKGRAGVAAPPPEEAWAEAAVWRVRLPPAVPPARDLLLRVRYVGDIARFYLDGRLLDDNYYNGEPFDLGLRRFAPAITHGELLLKILPLRKDSPIYLPDAPRLDFSAAGSGLSLLGSELIERHEVSLLVE